MFTLLFILLPDILDSIILVIILFTIWLGILSLSNIRASSNDLPALISLSTLINSLLNILSWILVVNLIVFFILLVLFKLIKNIGKNSIASFSILFIL